jgi:Adenylosuccinate synthetase (EC 6.3.4.4)
VGQCLEKNQWLEKLYGQEGFDPEKIFEEYAEYGERLKDYICDTSVVLDEALEEGKKILFEGAQGIMLDIDQGTYPYVTSSNPVAGGAAIGSGIGPTKIRRVVGVMKAYTTRVGDGPFPTELTGELAHQIRETGREYGTTTGRPRRVGWLDAVVVRHSIRVSGVTDLCLNSLDVLTGIDPVRICVAYRYRNRVIRHYPADLDILSECEPIYEDFPGWQEDLRACRTLADFPDNARRYVERVMELTGVDLATVSVGPDREQTKVLKTIW